MKRYRVIFKGKQSMQTMTLLAKDADEARRLAERAQFRRHERFPLTFARLEEAKDLPPAQMKAELEKRKRDVARYDDGDMKITKVEEAP